MNRPVPGVCYSASGRGQSPINGVFPTREQVLEDLRLLADLGFRRLRMYEPNLHAETTLELIAAEGLPAQSHARHRPRRRVPQSRLPMDSRAASGGEVCRKREAERRAAREASGAGGKV